MNKQKYNQYQAYINGTSGTIYDVYCRPSDAKINAFYKIRGKMYEDGGRNFRITSAGNFFFSCGYEDNNNIYYYTPYDWRIVINKKEIEEYENKHRAKFEKLIEDRYGRDAVTFYNEELERAMLRIGWSFKQAAGLMFMAIEEIEIEMRQQAARDEIGNIYLY